MNIASIDHGRDRPRAMKPLVSMRAALGDNGLLGNNLVGESWEGWRTLLIAAMGEALNRAERRLFTKLTGRATEPLQLVEMLVAVVGRRGGKSRAMAALAAYIAGLCDHSGVLAPGERGVLLLIAPDQRQANILLNYIKAVFEQSPLLKQLIANDSPHDFGFHYNGSLYRFRKGRTPLTAELAEACEHEPYVKDNGAKVVYR